LAGVVLSEARRGACNNGPWTVGGLKTHSGSVSALKRALSLKKQRGAIEIAPLYPITQEYIRAVIVVIPPNDKRLANNYVQGWHTLHLFIKLFR
jgi:hypothetical protein